MYCPNPQCPNLLEHGEPAEFRDGVADCAECGHRLEHGEAPPPPAEAPAEPVDWVTVAVYDGGAAAHGAKGLLEAEGIDAVLANEHFAGMVDGPATAIGGVALAVPAAEAERARELIESYSAPGAELPLDDDYESAEDYGTGNEAYPPSAGAPEAGASGGLWRLLAALLFLAAIVVTFLEWSG